MADLPSSENEKSLIPSQTLQAWNFLCQSKSAATGLIAGSKSAARLLRNLIINLAKRLIRFHYYRYSKEVGARQCSAKNDSPSAIL